MSENKNDEKKLKEVPQFFQLLKNKKIFMTNWDNERSVEEVDPSNLKINDAFAIEDTGAENTALEWAMYQREGDAFKALIKNGANLWERGSGFYLEAFRLKDSDLLNFLINNLDLTQLTPEKSLVISTINYDNTKLKGTIFDEMLLSCLQEKNLPRYDFKKGEWTDKAPETVEDYTKLLESNISDLDPEENSEKAELIRTFLAHPHIEKYLITLTKKPEENTHSQKIFSVILANSHEKVKEALIAYGQAARNMKQKEEIKKKTDKEEIKEGTDKTNKKNETKANEETDKTFTPSHTQTHKTDSTKIQKQEQQVETDKGNKQKKPGSG